MDFMTYEQFESRTCKCAHDVSEHRVVNGGCRGCQCTVFRSLNPEAEDWALKWSLRILNPWWVGGFAVTLLAYLWCMHWLAVNDKAPWYIDIGRSLFVLYCLRPSGWIVGGPIALVRAVRRWIDRQAKERPYDRLQLERIEREAGQ